jgi:hypothetical protein
MSNLAFSGESAGTFSDTSLWDCQHSESENAKSVLLAHQSFPISSHKSKLFLGPPLKPLWVGWGVSFHCLYVTVSSCGMSHVNKDLHAWKDLHQHIDDDPSSVRCGVIYIFSLFYISNVSTKYKVKERTQRTGDSISDHLPHLSLKTALGGREKTWLAQDTKAGGRRAGPWWSWMNPGILDSRILTQDPLTHSPSHSFSNSFVSIVPSPGIIELKGGPYGTPR